MVTGCDKPFSDCQIPLNRFLTAKYRDVKSANPRRRYRTQLCKDGLQCGRRACFFAHASNQLRPPTDAFGNVLTALQRTGSPTNGNGGGGGGGVEGIVCGLAPGNGGAAQVE